MKTAFVIFITVVFLNIKASSLLEFSGAHDSTNPFNASVLSHNAEAAYFNPAMLVLSMDSVKISTFMLIQSLDINHYSRPGGLDVPDSVLMTDRRKTTYGNRYTPMPTNKLLNEKNSMNYDDFDTVISIGLTKSIIKDWLALGLYAVLPATSIQTQTPFYPDEREQYFSNNLHFELFEDRFQQMNVNLGLGGRISSFLLLGAGLSFTSYTVTNNQVFVPDTQDPSLQIINSQLEVSGGITPFFSFTAIPFENLSIVGSLHFPNNTGKIELNNIMQVSGITDTENEEVGDYLSSSSEMLFGYHPMKFSIGASYALRFLSYEWKPALNINWNRWSTYINRHGEHPRDKWKDVFSFSTGLQLSNDNRDMGLDFMYTPSPVPDQNGRDNYVDNDRLGFSAGYTEYFHFEHVSIAGGINLQLQWLIKRSTTKSKALIQDTSCGVWNSGKWDFSACNSDNANLIIDEVPDPMGDEDSDAHERSMEGEAVSGLQTNNPGYPGFDSSGFIVGAGVFFKLYY